MYATGGLARLREPALSPRFLELTYDDFSEVRVSAAFGLAAIYEPSFRHRLATLACGDSDLAVREEAAQSLLETTDYLMRMTRPTEIVFLAGLLPVVAGAGWVLLLGRDGPSVQRRRAWLVLVAACYVGFVLGFLKLWGFIEA
jgi:hypothetical protein